MSSTWLFLALLAAQPATPTPADRIDRARQLQSELEYDAANEELMAALIDDRISDDERVVAHYQAGIINRIMGNDVEARLHFLWVLRRHPDARLPDDAPPKLHAFFDLVREEASSTAPAVTTLPPPPDDAASANDTAANDTAANDTAANDTAANGPAGGAAAHADEDRRSTPTHTSVASDGDGSRRRPSSRRAAPPEESEEEGLGPWVWVTVVAVPLAAGAAVLFAGAGAGVVVLGAVASSGGPAEEPSLGTVDTRGSTLGEIDLRAESR